MSEYKVDSIKDGMQEFFVEFNGTKYSKNHQFYYPYFDSLSLQFR